MVNISGDGFRVAEPAARGAIEFSASAVNSEQQQNPSVAMLGATATRDASGRTAEMRGRRGGVVRTRVSKGFQWMEFSVGSYEQKLGI